METGFPADLVAGRSLRPDHAAFHRVRHCFAERSEPVCPDRLRKHRHGSTRHFDARRWTTSLARTAAPSTSHRSLFPTGPLFPPVLPVTAAEISAYYQQMFADNPNGSVINGVTYPVLPGLTIYGYLFNPQQAMTNYRIDLFAKTDLFYYQGSAVGTGPYTSGPMIRPISGALAVPVAARSAGTLRLLGRAGAQSGAGDCGALSHQRATAGYRLVRRVSARRLALPLEYRRGLQAHRLFCAHLRQDGRRVPAGRQHPDHRAG